MRLVFAVVFDVLIEVVKSECCKIFASLSDSCIALLYQLKGERERCGLNSCIVAKASYD